MEKEIIWTDTAVADIEKVVLYLQNNWPEKVLDLFLFRLQRKLILLQRQPNIGYKSAKYSRFRQTLISPHYKLVYSVKKRAYCYLENQAHKNEISIVHNKSL